MIMEFWLTNPCFHMHIRPIANKAVGVAANLLIATNCRSRNLMLTLYITHVRPLLEHCSCLWNAGYFGDLRLLESVQRSWAQQIDGIVELSYRELLLTLYLYSLNGHLFVQTSLNVGKSFTLSAPSLQSIYLPQHISRHICGHCSKLPFNIPMSISYLYFSPWGVFNCGMLCYTTFFSLNFLQAFKSALHNTLGDILYDFVESFIRWSHHLSTSVLQHFKIYYCFLQYSFLMCTHYQSTHI